jgi:hypothetical protein
MGINCGAISSADLATCPQFRFDADHWIGGHKIEECHLLLRKRVEEEETRLSKAAANQIDLIRAKQKEDLEIFKRSLRG